MSDKTSPNSPLAVAVSLDSIRGDGKQRNEGIWFDHPWFKDVRVKIRSSRSKVYRQMEVALLDDAEIPVDAKDGTRQEVIEAITRRCTQALVVDWSGLTEDYSESTCSKMVEAWATSDDYHEFFIGIRNKSITVGAAKQTRFNDSVKN